jgi:heat shock protein HtpX
MIQKLKEFKMMRIALFLLTNVAIMVVMSFFISVFGADKYLSNNGIDYGTLLVFSAIIGFSGSLYLPFTLKTDGKTFCWS